LGQTKSEGEYSVATNSISNDFQKLHHIAGRWLHNQVSQYSPRWIRLTISDIAGEHYSFFAGNQAFFVRIEDVDGEIIAPGTRNAWLRMVMNWGGVACLLRAKRYHDSILCAAQVDFELVEPDSMHPIDIRKHLLSQPPEMNEWEIHDFGIIFVRQYVERDLGGRVLSYQSDPDVLPSIWVEIDGKQGAIVVCTGRYPANHLEPTEFVTVVSTKLAALQVNTFYASVTIMSVHEQPELASNAAPLMRGEGLIPRFLGLEPIAPGSNHG
jgi:hypothetical protein